MKQSFVQRTNFHVNFYSFFSDIMPTKRNSCSSDFLSYSCSTGNLHVCNGVDPNSTTLSDYSTQINTNFSSMGKTSLSNETGDNVPFNFSKFVKTNRYPTLKTSASSVTTSRGEDLTLNSDSPPSVWALDCNERFVILGCSNGRIEVWEIEEGAFQV